jgi:hypothetical protein
MLVYTVCGCLADQSTNPTATQALPGTGAKPAEHNAFPGVFHSLLAHRGACSQLVLMIRKNARDTKGLAKSSATSSVVTWVEKQAI